MIGSRSDSTREAADEYEENPTTRKHVDPRTHPRSNPKNVLNFRARCWGEKPQRFSTSPAHRQVLVSHLEKLVSDSSLWGSYASTCPHCGTSNPPELIASVDAERRTFALQFTCSKCRNYWHQQFSLPPEAQHSFTISKAARVFGIPRAVLEQAVKDKVIRTRYIQHRVVRGVDVLDWLESRETEDALLDRGDR
jgi:hypothetical protein